MKALTKRIAMYLLAAALGASLPAAPGLFAQQAQAQVRQTAAAWVGSGTEADPYLIQTADDLAALSDSIRNGTLSGRRIWFEQTNDISLSGIGTWTPIGTDTLVFSGVYHGNGHTISGMSAEGADYVGLFGHIAEAELYDICISGRISVRDGSGLSGYRSVGGLVGRAGKARANDSAEPDRNVISGCTSEVEILSNKTGNGGLVGQTSSDTDILDCLYAGSMRLTESSAFASAGGTGGIIGYSAADDRIEGCVNRGNITNTGGGDTNIGGILGEAAASSSTTIRNCYNTGALYSTGTSGSLAAGGIIGKRTNWYDQNSTFPEYRITIANCYNTGAVAAPNKDNTNAGGIIGYTILDSFGNLVVTDENTSHVYSLKKKCPSVIYAGGKGDVSGSLQTAGTFVDDTSDQDEGIPWLLGQLGSRFKADANYANNGFPLLDWQAEGEALSGDNVRVAFHVTYDTQTNRAVGSEPRIEIDGGALDGTNAVLSAGTHSYRISERGYETAEGMFVLGENLTTVQTVPVKLTAQKYIWTVQVVPENAELTLRNESSQTVRPESGKDGVYTFALYNGDYTVSAAADGYYDAQAAFAVAYGDGNKELTLQIIPETAPQEPTMEDGYYLITKPQELSWINEQATHSGTDAAIAMAGANIRLMADIDMTGYDWYPMNGRELAKRIYSDRYSGGCYTGIFDGNGHTISNLTIDRTNQVFSMANADRTDAVGALFGYTKGAVIRDVGVTGTVRLGDAPDSSMGDFCHVGGIIGMAQSDTHIERCFAHVDVTFYATGYGYPTGSDTYIGGIVGSLTTGSVVENCYATGALTGSGTQTVNIGGITGSTRGDYHVYDDATNELIYEQQNQVINCYSTSEITSDPLYSGYIGGITGMVRAASVGKIPEIYCNFALNRKLDGSGKCEANRILGNSEAFAQSGFYNYALDEMKIVRAGMNETEANYQNSYGRDISQEDAVRTATYSNIGWKSSDWKLNVLNEYPRLSWENMEEHVHDYEETVTAPTCYEYGYTTYTCRICGETVVGNYTAPGAHEFGEWTESTNRENSHERTCTLCGYQEIAVHKWEDLGVTKEPAADAPGEHSYACTVCGAVRTDEIPAAADDWKDAEYTWSDGNTYVTAKAVSGTDTSRVLTEKVHTTAAAVKKATAERAGIVTYTAEFKNSVFETQTRRSIIPKVTLAAPEIRTAVRTGGRLEITWDKVAGASRYRVEYRQTGASDWIRKETTGTRLTINGMKTGETWECRVTAVSAATDTAEETAQESEVISVLYGE